MSMSTLIDDLPDSVPENVRMDINSLQNELNNSYNDNTMMTDIDNGSNVTITKKKVRFEDEDDRGFFTIVRNEFSEENLMILIFLMLASLPYLDPYINRISFVQYNPFMSAVMKAVVLFVTYLIVKIYVLPKLKL